MKNILILITLLFAVSAFSQTEQSHLGGNAPGTETLPDSQNAKKTPSGVDQERFKGDSMKIDTFEGKQRMEDVKNTGDDTKKTDIIEDK